MGIITWNETLSVGVTEIDTQHQQLISQINKLHEAMKQRRGKDVMGSIIDSLVAYTATHFSTEENYFARFEYPETSAHKQEHAAFVKKVSEFQEGFNNGSLSLTISVMNFLSDWLQNHIQGTDKRYSAFFKEHGLS